MKQLNASPLLPCPCLPTRRRFLSSRPAPRLKQGTLPPWTERAWHTAHHHAEYRCPASSADAVSGAGPGPDPDNPVLSVFSRIGERDPYRQVATVSRSSQSPMFCRVQAVAFSKATSPRLTAGAYVACRRLGVARDAPFEEIQDAHNYLWQVLKRKRAQRALASCCLQQLGDLD